MLGVVVVFSFLGNTNAIYSYSIRRDIVGQTQEEAWRVFDSETSKVLAAIEDVPAVVALADKQRRLTVARQNLSTQIVDSRNPGFGELAQEHYAEIMKILDIQLTPLRAPDPTAPVEQLSSYAARLDALIEEQADTQFRGDPAAELVDFQSNIQRVRAFYEGKMREKEYSADTTDLMTRDLDGYAVRARELLPAPVELRDHQQFGGRDRLVSIHLAQLHRSDQSDRHFSRGADQRTTGSARSARNDPRVSPRQLVLIWLTKHTEKTLLDVARANVTPLVGTINEPAANRIDMNEFDNVVDGSGIEGKTGNFLFTVGSVASGKSTLQNFLVHRLHVDENIHFDRTSSDGNTASEAYLNAWVQNIAAGYLPERTHKGVLREFNVRFGQRGKPNLDFSFIEIAGEDIRSIVPTAEHKQPRLHEHLERYLRQGGVNKRFLFVSDASRNRLGKGRFEEDVLFDTLIRYLLSDTGVGLRSLNLLFIAAKWDVVQSEYKSDRQYFQTNFPQTRSTIKASPRDPRVVYAI